MANLTLPDARGLVQDALAASGCGKTNAAAQARAVITAKAVQGITGKRLTYRRTGQGQASA